MFSSFLLSMPSKEGAQITPVQRVRHESHNWQTALIRYLLLFNLFKEQRTMIFQACFHENPTTNTHDIEPTNIHYTEAIHRYDACKCQNLGALV